MPCVGCVPLRRFRAGRPGCAVGVRVPLPETRLARGTPRAGLASNSCREAPVVKALRREQYAREARWCRRREFARTVAFALVRRAPARRPPRVQAAWCRARRHPRPAHVGRVAACRAASISASTVAGSAATPLGLQFQPAATGALGRAGGDEQLHRRVREDHRADVAAVQHRAVPAAEVALEVQQRGADRRDWRRPRGRAHRRPGRAGRRGPGRPAAGAGRRLGRRRVARVGASVQHAAADGAIQQPGIEIGQAERRGEPAGQRALPGRGGAVDGDDRRDAAPQAAPPGSAGSRFISAAKPGKLVSMKPASSTVTGCSVARPMTSALIARRWSIWVSTIPPPGRHGRRRPARCRSSPSISTRAPFTASSAAVAASRSLSFTRSSFRPRMRVVPGAVAATTARTGYSSIIVGRMLPRHLDAAQRAVRHDEVADRLAALHPAVLDRRCRRPSRAAWRTGRSAARSARHSRSSAASPAPAAPRPAGRRRRTGSPGTRTSAATSSGWPSSSMMRPPPGRLHLDGGAEMAQHVLGVVAGRLRLLDPGDARAHSARTAGRPTSPGPTATGTR